MTEMFGLHGRVALVTGGSRGLGREIVLAFAAAGADVVVASRSLEACEAVTEQVRAGGRRALPVSAHVGRWGDIERLVEAAYAEFGRVDVLVNNAGMSPLAPSSLETGEDLFDKVVDVNLKGPFRITSLVAPRMVQAGGGSVINISSTGSLMPRPHFGPYAAAKAGLNALTVAFALEYGPTVRVNTIAAGPFLTDVSKYWPAEQRTSSRSAIERPGRPDEIVGAALYLASDASSFTSGALLRVDGGQY
jgi:NAD(P)-dependent dehydrogenase (short-subunit alcohol dehydrogenase family)